MINNTDNWTYEEFHAFVMLYAANIDGEITPDEGSLIVSSLSTEAFARIKEVFQQCDDADALDIIMSYRGKYCCNQTEKDKILADMLEIYQAHEGFDQVERGVHQLFKRML